MSTQTYLINFGFNDFLAPELIYHVFRNDLQQTKKLLESGIDISQVDESGRTALWWASENQSLEMLQLLFKNKALENVSLEAYTSYICKAAERNNRIVYNFWACACVDFYQGSKSHALQSAVSGASTEILKELLKDGADPNYQNASDGSTALHMACEKLRVEAVRILIEAGADTSLLSKFGFSAADHAVKKHFLSPYKWQKSQKAARDEILKTLAEAKSYIGKIT